MKYKFQKERNRKYATRIIRTEESWKAFCNEIYANNAEIIKMRNQNKECNNLDLVA